MSKKRCKKSKCDSTCLGCLYELSTECIYLENILSGISTKDIPAGTDLTVVFEAISDKFATLSAEDITVTALDCIGESIVTGTDLQSVLEDLCILIDDIQTDISVLQEIAEDHDWYVEETTESATSIDDNIYTLGMVGIGLDAPTRTLDVVGNLGVVATNTKLFVDNNITVSALLASSLDYFIGQVDGDNSTSGLSGKENFSALTVHYTSISGFASLSLDKTSTKPFMALEVNDEIGSSTSFDIYHNKIQIDGIDTYTGTFIENTGKTVTVVKGLITTVV